MSKLGILLRDKYAALVVSEALLGDRIQDLSADTDPKLVDGLCYVLNTLSDMKNEIGEELRAIQQEMLQADGSTPDDVA